MKVTHKKTGRVYDIDWKGVNPPTDADIDKIAEDMNRPAKSFKENIYEQFRSLPSDLLSKAKEVDQNLRDPLIDIGEYADKGMEYIQPDDPGAEYSLPEKFAYNQFLNPDSGRDERSRVRGAARGAVKGIGDVIAPTGLSIGAVGALGRATKGAKAAKAAVPAKSSASVSIPKPAPVPVKKGPGPSNQPSQAAIDLLHKDPMVKTSPEMAMKMRRDQVRRVLEDSGVAAEDIAKIEEQYFSGAEDMHAAARSAGVENFKTGFDEKELAAMNAINKFADGGMKIDELSAILKESQISAQKVQSLLTKVGIKPREVGLSARDLKMNPRAPEATNPRALGISDRQLALQDEFKDITGGNIQYPDDDIKKLSMTMELGDDPAAAAAASAVSKIDLDDLPENIPPSYISELAKANNLDEDAVKVVLQQRYKQQQVRKARKALSQPKSPQAQSIQGLAGPTPPAAGSSILSPPAPPSNAPGRAYAGARGASSAPPAPPSIPPSGTPAPTSGFMHGPNMPHSLMKGKDASLWENILGIPKSLTTPIDQPFLRQGAIPTLAHPKQSFDAWKQGMKSYTQPGFDKAMLELEMRPRAQQYKDFGILDSDLKQQIPSDWANELPIIKQSGQNYEAGMGTLRANRFDDLAGKIEDDFWGKSPDLKGDYMQGPIDPREYEAAARMVSDTTGRGSLGKFDKGQEWQGVGKAANIAMFSPKFRASRFSVLNPKNYTGSGKYGSPSGIPLAEFRKDMGKFGGGLAGLLGAGALAGGDVELDPRSSDFSQLQFGDTRLDFGAGMRPIVNIAARSAAGFVPGLDTYKSSKTDETGMANEPENPGEYIINALGNTAGNLGHYARTGLAPGLPSMGADITPGIGAERKHGEWTRKNVVGKDISDAFQTGPAKDVPYLPWLANQITPMYPQDVYEGFEDLGAGEIPLAALGFLGAGQSTYGDSSNLSTAQNQGKNYHNGNKKEKPEKSSTKAPGRSRGKKARRVY